MFERIQNEIYTLILDSHNGTGKDQLIRICKNFHDLLEEL